MAGLHGRLPDTRASEAGNNAVLVVYHHQVMEFLDGQPRVFSVPMAPEGTPFQQRVWERLLTVPHGQITRYAEVARAWHSGARAVGAAKGGNPVSLIVPCHRVVGANGALIWIRTRAPPQAASAGDGEPTDVDPQRSMFLE